MLQIMSAVLSTDRSDRRCPVAARSWASNRMFRARRRAMLCHSESAKRVVALASDSTDHRILWLVLPHRRDDETRLDSLGDEELERSLVRRFALRKWDRGGGRGKR